jgi:hypothetical protein
VISYKVLWTIKDRRFVSVVSYDKPSADQRADELRRTATDVEIVAVKPGQSVMAVQPMPVRLVRRKYTNVKRDQDSA